MTTQYAEATSLQDTNVDDVRNPKAERYNTNILKIPGIAFDVKLQDPKQRIQAYIDSYRTGSSELRQGFDEVFMREHVSVVTAAKVGDRATAVYEVKAAPIFASRMGNMHGGAVAMILDMCTTMTAAPLAREDFWWFGGVSRTLNMTYLRPVRTGMELLIECEVMQQGARLATIRGQIRDKKTGQLLSLAEHNKASINFVKAIERL
ncbi:hypothetical protein H2204_004809 [Knufia peltigerae]|uniref:Thioesterase domain-containing protein n=1 Tax=Knufia peltigerae TaxID=1002370 RepID=A0AA39D0B4_9EURO|nr:hypothetical protein H2204_004809 [Knufia peltigerae]